jgi:hypothetical protein
MTSAPEPEPKRRPTDATSETSRHRLRQDDLDIASGAVEDAARHLHGDGAVFEAYLAGRVFLLTNRYVHRNRNRNRPGMRAYGRSVAALVAPGWTRSALSPDS